jgi:hypothetical protein
MIQFDNNLGIHVMCFHLRRHHFYNMIYKSGIYGFCYLVPNFKKLHITFSFKYQNNLMQNLEIIKVT